MQFAVTCLLCLTISLTVYASFEKRFLLNSIIDKLMKEIDFGHLKDTINKILDMVGSNATAQQCVTACREVATKDILDAGCPWFCSAFQQLVQKLHIEDEKLY